MILLIPFPADAQIHINGFIDLESGHTQSTSKGSGIESKSKVSQFDQRYQLGISGVIVDPRLASYTGTIGIQNSSIKNEPFAGQSTKVTRDTLTYSLQTNLFPTRWPVSVFIQRNRISTETAADLLTDTFTLNWLLALRNLPTLHVALIQLGTDFRDPNNPKETRVRIANIGLIHQIQQTSFSFNYQLADYRIRDASTETSHSVGSFSFRGESSLSGGLFAHANATYFPKGSAFAPGLTTASETTGGIGLLHQASRFNQTFNYDFYDTAESNVRRDFLSYDVNYFPRGKTNYRGALAFSSLTSSQTDTTDYRVSGGIDHRPFFGLSLAGNLTVNHTQTSGLSTSTQDRVGAGGGVSYFKPLDLIQFTSSLQTDISFIQASPSSEQGSVWTNTLTLGGASRTLRTTQINGTYTYLWRQDGVTRIDDRQEHAFHLGLVSTPFNRLVLRGAADYQIADNPSFHGNTFVLDTQADFFPWRNIETTAGYRRSDYPGSSGSQDVSTSFVEGRYFRYIIRNLNLSVTAHWDRDTYSYTTQDRYLLSSLVNYQLGKISLSLDYRNEVTKYSTAQYTVQSVFVRASRPF